MSKLTPVCAALLLIHSIGYIGTSFATSTHSTKAKQSSHKQASKHLQSDKVKTLAAADSKSQNTPSSVQVTQPTTAAAETTSKPLSIPVDCLYQLSTTAPISDVELTQWAQQAAIKSFDYSFDKMDSQLQNLKSCFTDQGWLGFSDALKQSGNLVAIKAQQLTVSSEIEGQLQIDPFKNNQWKITVPLKVVYQNTQEKFIQSLTVEMIVTKKSATQLGIVQLIAAPKSKDGQLVTKAS